MNKQILFLHVKHDAATAARKAVTAFNARSLMKSDQAVWMIELTGHDIELPSLKWLADQ